jgi:hypothetical protein
MISVTCTCGKVLRAKNELAGRAAQCPHCQEKIKIPSAPSHGAPQRVAPALEAEGATGSNKTLLLSGIAVGLLAGLIVLVLYFGLNRNKPTGSSNDDANYASSAAPGVRTAPSITASPNPVPAGTEKFGTTTITWDTGDGSIGEVYVSVNGAAERLFAGNRSKGTLAAPWIGKGEHDFRLYAGTQHKTLLASVRVTRSK